MSKIAVVSDSHDHLPNIRLFLERASEISPEFLIHCGDFVAPFACRLFAQSGINWRGVFGNNDGERRGIMNIAKGAVDNDEVEIVMDGKKIYVIHDISKAPENVFERFDVVCCGHTHNASIAQKGNALVINPGELCGYLTMRPTFAILDTGSLKAEIVDL